MAHAVGVSPRLSGGSLLRTPGRSSNRNELEKASRTWFGLQDLRT